LTAWREAIAPGGAIAMVEWHEPFPFHRGFAGWKGEGLLRTAGR
jgi:hypothetical protein